MYFTGFADEAAKSMAGQIQATRELGWDCIESRSIDGTNIHDLSDEAFDVVDELLDLADHRVLAAGAVLAADFRDDAEAARVIAAFGDFDVGEVLGGEPETRGVVIGNVARLGGDQVLRRFVGRAVVTDQALDDRCDLVDLVEADEGIDLGHQVGEFLREAL